MGSHRLADKAPTLPPGAMTGRSVSGMLIARRRFSSIANMPLASMLWRGRPMGLHRPPDAARASLPAPGIISYECGMLSAERPVSPIAVTLIGLMPSRGRPMVHESPPLGAIRRCRYGMPLQAVTSIPIPDMPVGSTQWHGRLMAHALPRRAMMGRYMSGYQAHLARRTPLFPHLQAPS